MVRFHGSVSIDQFNDSTTLWEAKPDRSTGQVAGLTTGNSICDLNLSKRRAATKSSHAFDIRPIRPRNTSLVLQPRGFTSTTTTTLASLQRQNVPDRNRLAACTACSACSVKAWQERPEYLLLPLRTSTAEWAGMQAGLAVACYTVFRDGDNGCYRVRIPRCQSSRSFPRPQVAGTPQCCPLPPPKTA
ncbi:hypothetical protein BDV09DRAFT_173179 [Aspergillus tetrazonus]